MIPRIAEKQLKEIASYFPVVSLNGPRQSGKTTLIKKCFPDLPYVSLEDPDQRNMAIDDPRGFLQNFPQGAVMDEVQRTPQIFSYIQGIVDSNSDIKFVLSGSQNFLMSESITQSLAGRVGLLTLLPFSMEELTMDQELTETMEEQIYKGFYPRIYDKDIPANIYYPNYISTYVERDVRLIKNIENLDQFSMFMKLCAGRSGQILNYSNLANDAGISVNTAKAWISILEASYIVFTLPPHHKNFNKRLIKSSKIYFYDTGLLCDLLQISSPTQLQVHFNRGGIMENFCLLEIKKYFDNRGIRPQISFWQNNTGKEIDIILEVGTKTKAVEVKSGKTYNSGFMENLVYWQKLSGESAENSYVVYGGDMGRKMKNGHLVSWNKISAMLND